MRRGWAAWQKKAMPCRATQVLRRSPLPSPSSPDTDCAHPLNPWARPPLDCGHHRRARARAGGAGRGVRSPPTFARVALGPRRGTPTVEGAHPPPSVRVPPHPPSFAGGWSDLACIARTMQSARLQHRDPHGQQPAPRDSRAAPHPGTPVLAPALARTPATPLLRPAQTRHCRERVLALPAWSNCPSCPRSLAPRCHSPCPGTRPLWASLGHCETGGVAATRPCPLSQSRRVAHT